MPFGARALLSALPALFLFTVVGFGGLAACDDGGGETSSDVLDALDTSSCACTDGVCADDLCDVHVRLDPACGATISEATVSIDGVIVGTVTPDTPFRSCMGFACDSEVDVEVRGGGISTDVRRLSVALDPEVDLPCL